MPGYRAESLELLLARVLASAGRDQEAQAKFEALLQQFNSFDARAEYAIWAAKTGDGATANRLRAEIEASKKHWNRHTREINAPMMRRLDAAYEEAKKRA